MAEPTIKRDGPDEHGMTGATCERCGMWWLEYEEPVELLPGMVTGSGPRGHTCPEPYPPDTARYLAQFYAASQIPIHPRQKARIRLGLSEHPGSSSHPEHDARANPKNG